MNLRTYTCRRKETSRGNGTDQDAWADKQTREIAARCAYIWYVISMCVCVCVYVFICLLVCITYVYLCVYIYALCVRARIRAYVAYGVYNGGSSHLKGVL